MASGDTLIIFTPLSCEPPSSNSARLTARNAHTVLGFSDSTSESAVFKAIMPQSYSGATGITVYLHYAMASATTGDTDWDVYFERVSDSHQDIDSDGFAGVKQSTNNTVPGTSGHVDIISLAFTAGTETDAIVAGDAFRLKIARNTADTATGDAQLYAVELRDT